MTNAREAGEHDARPGRASAAESNALLTTAPADFHPDLRAACLTGEADHATTDNDGVTPTVASVSSASTWGKPPRPVITNGNICYVTELHEGFRRSSGRQGVYPGTSPEATAMAKSQFSVPRLARVRKAMEGAVERVEVPGVVTLVSRKGETHVDAVGRASVGGEKVRRNTIFRVSSMTKPITAVAALVLIEDGRLRLDDPVDPLLPELANRTVMRRWDGPLSETMPASRAITVRDLLTFRMGFGIPMAMPDSTPIQREMTRLKLGQGPPTPWTPPPPDEWIRSLGTLPLMQHPGEGWAYSTGADVLGVLIARASGMPFERFLEERIFGPLGMVDTAFEVPSSKMVRFTTAYWTNPMTGTLDVYDDARTGQWSRLPAFPSGAAGLVSTVDDYLAFAQMLMDGGKAGRERVISRPSVELMTSDQITPQQKASPTAFPGFFESHGWGFCVSMATRREDFASLGTYGWNGGLGSIWRNDPKEGLVAILLSNASWASPAPPAVCVDFLTAAYQALSD